MNLRLVLAACVLAAGTRAQSGPFDVTTIIRLKRAWSDDGPTDWGSKIREMWPWKSKGTQQEFTTKGDVEVHARTNALGFPLRIGGQVVAAEVEDQVPECAAYNPCDGWDTDAWLLEASSVTAPPIQPQRLDGDAVGIGETVKVRLTTRKNEAGGLTFGLCSDEACATMLMKGINDKYEMAYDVGILRTNTLFYNRRAEWQASGGPPNASFAEGTVHDFVGTRVSPYSLQVWHAKNKTAAIQVPLEPDRLRLRMFSGLGPTAYLKPEDNSRIDGDVIAVGERVRVHLTNYDRVEISFAICSPSACSVVRVRGVSKDKRLDYQTWITGDGEISQRGSPTLDSRCISCGSRAGVAKGGTNLFVVQRRSDSEMAVWLEDNPRDVVTVPLLDAAQDRLRLETFFSVATFIRDAVWSSRGPGSALVSPPVGGVSDVVCVSLVYLATDKLAGIRLAARAANGTDFPLARVRPDQANAWRFNRTVVDLPRALRRSDWRLVVEADLPVEGARVLVQRVGGCNHLDDEDVMLVGETSLPAYVPGYNVSWGAARQRRAPPAKWCANGGVKDDFGTCVCPPGFRGPVCAEGCGPNRYGMDCGGRCSELGEGCRGMLFCAPGLPCACAPGFKGETCDQECDVGEYGSNCAQTCQYCKDGACDRFTGQCSQDRKLLFGNECGRPPSTEALTVNGMVATVDSFPWHGAVYMRHASAKQYKFVCGAALVTPSVLISAAHCFYDNNLNKLLPAERYAVALGKIRSGWDAKETGRVHKSKVSAVYIPDAYRGTVSNYVGDIAVVELQDPVPPGPNVATVCVDPGLTLVQDEQLRVAGWGDDSPSALDLLEYVNMPYLPTKTCYRRASDQLIKYVTADKFCSIIESEADQHLARGDSGGGAVVERDGIWYLQGVVSLRQGTNDYTFTNVTFSDHLQWMRDVLKLDGAEPK
ncbi:hypothetical protein FOCC_FOCC001657 [Frankliniella occidentalis]|uniref:Uncharacterized protein LOC113210799 n=1 Tax=Frankliniella occidentalis TaxID=133901 RepID=A0A6J1SV27_FRAOC|nr:uncharacterized protein LOC113210799 [Frankliniella occidentalis]KAE8751808.1 hypothetical protein FOCC_FOCC001657 [Frankliniella occidentalis]